MLRRLLVLCLLSLAPVACARSAPPALTIVHFNDVYEIGPMEGGRVGGLARVSTVIKDLRASRGPVMTTLGGDFLSPSALATAQIDGEAIGGRQMIDVLNALGLQWATLGNHEFDLQEDAMRARLGEAQFRIVASNVTDANGQMFPGTEGFAVVPVQVGAHALRIGLIGITIDSNQRPWVTYAPAIEAAKAAVSRVKATGQVDAIIALTHLTLAEDQALVDAVPEIDLTLGGHEHENWLVYRGAGLTPIVKADANVRTIAVISLTFPEDQRPEVSVQLRPITSETSPDAVVNAEVTRWTDTAFEAFRKDGFEPTHVVGTLTSPLDGRESTVRNRPGALTALITDAMAHEDVAADVAIMNGGSVRIDDVMPRGPLTEYDVIRILPFGGTVARASMPGSLLARVLDVGISNQGSGGYLHVKGATRQGGQWFVQGQPLNPSTRYQVALTDFLLSGRERNLDFLTRTNPEIQDVQDLRDIRQALISEISRRYPPQK